VTSVYKLREGSMQYGFNKSRHKLQIIGGGFGNGKTTGLSIKSLQLVTDYPGSVGLLGRATYPKLRGTLQRVFFDWCPPDWIERMPTKDDNTCHFKNGSKVDFRYINQRGRQQADGQTTSNLLSASYDWIGVDQVEDPEITHKDILDLLGRLRGDTPYRPPGDDDRTMPNTGPRWMMLTCNPTANWVFKELIHPYMVWRDRGIKMPNLPVDPVTNECIIDLWEGSTYTNKENLADDYIRTLEAMYHGQMKERFLMGGWAAFEGLVHPSFDIRVHGLTRQEALDYLGECLSKHVRVRLVEGYDFGLSSPTVYMIGFVDNYGRVIIIDGFYKPNLNYTEHKNEIEFIRGRYLNSFGGKLKLTDAINADPSIYKQQVVRHHGETGETIAQLLEGYDLNIRPASNAVDSGIAKVNAYLADRVGVPHLTLDDRQAGPMLYVVDDLSWFQDEIANYYWKRDSQGRLEEVPQGHNDHAMNTVKYMLAFLPQPSEIKPPEALIEKPWMRWQEVEVSRHF
jgi:hypothetical protein